MKILLINSVCGIRSTGRICTDLARGAESLGWEAKVAYGRESVPQALSYLAQPIGSKQDVYLHALRARLLDDSGRGSRRATRDFIRWAQSWDPDVIHLHNLHGYYLNMEELFSWLRNSGKKIFWTLHDGWAFSGHSATCDEAGCEKWKTGCGHCPLKNVYPKSFLDFSPRNWQEKKGLFTGVPNLTLITPSRWLAGLVKESFLGEYPVEVIPNGIDTAVFTPCPGVFRRKYGLEGKKILLGVASSWTDSKGYSDFLRLPRLLGEAYKVVLVGLTPKQMELLPGEILGITRTESVRQLAEIYSDADLLLNLTYCDTYPTVNLEALCCGTPVLTYRTGGSPESIPDGCGAALDRGSLEQIVSHIPKGLEMKKNVTEKAELFHSRFAKERSVEEHKKLYEKAVRKMNE